MEAATQAAPEAVPTEAPVSEEGQPAVQAAPEPPKREMRKAKVNGKEIDVDIDEVLREYQKYTAGGERLQQAAEKEKSLQKWLENAKTNPWSVFEEFGLNADELAEQRLLKKLEYEMLSPDARKSKDLEKEMEGLKYKLEETEREKKEARELLEADKIEGLKTQYAKQLDEAIPKFYKERNLEATPEQIVYAIENIIAHAEMHGEELDLNTALETAHERFNGLLNKHVSKIKGKDLLSLLTPDQIDAIRKHQLDNLYQQNPLRQKAESRGEGKPRASKTQRMSTDDFFKNIIDKRFE